MRKSKCRLLTKDEITEMLNKTPNIDIESLLKSGYCEAKEFHRHLENGERQERKD